MEWEIEYTREFGRWWDGLREGQRDTIFKSVEKLRLVGPDLGRPDVDTLGGTRHANLKELRASRTIRVIFAFDPRRSAILPIGGDKGGDKRFYRRTVPLAERLYDQHLDEIRREGLL